MIIKIIRKKSYLLCFVYFYFVQTNFFISAQGKSNNASKSYNSFCVMKVLQERLLSLTPSALHGAHSIRPTCKTSLAVDSKDDLSQPSLCEDGISSPVLLDISLTRQLY